MTTAGADKLLLVAALLCGGFTIRQTDFAWPALQLAALGAENCVFEAGADVKISLTFTSGNLVKIGHRIAFAGGLALAFLP